MDNPNFSITTAIAYTNGNPHIGHAYEIVCADVIARFKRLLGYDVHFLTGTDEHGQKVSECALSNRLSPIDYCDTIVEKFKKMYIKLAISNDHFIRTTSNEHIIKCQRVWNTMMKNNDIYLGMYRGWYCVREELFVSEKEAQDADYKDPVTGKDLIKYEEESYFFRLSKYNAQIIKHIDKNPQFIFPNSKRNEILERLKEPLVDLSISRTSVSWGIRVPDDNKHVMYVWFDALINYLSGVPIEYLPTNIHLIGKDILWFHSVIWPAMLMSCNLPLPQQIVCHGFINDNKGQKMSKSIGNIVDPCDIIDKYSIDMLRYYVIKTGIFGTDFSYSCNRLIECHDFELQATIGNLVNRIFTLTVKYCDSRVPIGETENIIDLLQLTNIIENAIDNLRIQDAVEIAMNHMKLINNWLSLKKPWLKDNEKANTIRTVLESLYIVGHFLLPIIPISMTIMFDSLGHNPTNIFGLKQINLIPGTKIVCCQQLFPRIMENSYNRNKK